MDAADPLPASLLQPESEQLRAKARRNDTSLFRTSNTYQSFHIAYSDEMQ
jgi:hypothetical protein